MATPAAIRPRRSSGECSMRHLRKRPFLFALPKERGRLVRYGGGLLPSSACRSRGTVVSQEQLPTADGKRRVAGSYRLQSGVSDQLELGASGHDVHALPSRRNRLPSAVERARPKSDQREPMLVVNHPAGRGILAAHDATIVRPVDMPVVDRRTDVRPFHAPDDVGLGHVALASALTASEVLPHQSRRRRQCATTLRHTYR